MEVLNQKPSKSRPLGELRAALYLLSLVGLAMILPKTSRAADFSVYSIYRGVDLGIPGEAPYKDYYINMGINHGIQRGSVVQVVRRTPTYDVTHQSLYKDLEFPIAKLRVIHVEENAAITRLETLSPLEKTPSISPRAVMVGDLVRAID